MKRRILAALALTALLGAACNDQSPLIPAAEQVVVRGYLFAGAPVTEIRLTSALDLGSEDSVAPAISDASVSLFRNGVSYSLAPTDGRPGFYNYPGADLAVSTGDEFEIVVSYSGAQVTALTTVPPAPSGVGVYPQELTVSQINVGEPGGFGRFFQDDTTALVVSWNAADGGYYYITLQNMEADPTPIYSDVFGDRIALRFISSPITGGEYRITRGSVGYYGRYLVKVFRVNQEYVDLFLSRSQDSRDLNEPLTNVVNGLGVFTAFNSDSVFIDVVEEP